MKMFAVFSFVVSITAFVHCETCDAVTNRAAGMSVANAPTIVIAAGYQIDVAGWSVPIQGVDECPGGWARHRTGHNCVVVINDQTTVQVLIALPTGAVRENWRVIREAIKTESGGTYVRTTLQRPDGSFVWPRRYWPVSGPGCEPSRKEES